MTYAAEHLPHTRAAKNAAYNVGNLSAWWSDKRLDDVTAKNCRAYAADRSPAAARRDLETLRAAIGHWHREYGPLPVLPAVVMPDKAEPRERWLTRSEAARLLWAARRTEHLKRFILIGLYTGSRSGAILNLKWEWVDVERGVMRRRQQGDTESNKRRPPVRIGRRLLSFLRRWRDRDLESRCSGIVHYNGASVQKLRRSWAAASSRAGLVGVSPHTLRHTRATWLMQAGVDPWEAAGHLGMSVETLQRNYAKHSPDFQKKAAEV
jgi:integrase